MARMDADATLSKFSRLGRYQIYIATLCSITTFFNGQPVVQDSFVNYTPDHRCYVPTCDTADASYDEDFLNFTTSSSDGEWDKCQRHSSPGNDSSTLHSSHSIFSHPLSLFNRHSKIEVGSDKATRSDGRCVAKNFDQSTNQECDDGWVYDDELFKSTTTMEFDFVCDQAFLTSTTASAYNIGMLFGSVMCGVMADKFGRKFAFLVSLCFMTVGSTVGALSVDPIMLILMRIPTGFGAVAQFQIAFILCAEYMPPKYRSSIGFVLNSTFALGEAMVGVYAIFIRQWRWLQLAISVPPAITLLYYWLIPESVRWLSREGRDEEAEAIVRRMAQVNKIPMPDIVYLEKADESAPNPVDEKTSILDLMRYPNMRKRSLILFSTWFTASMVYYGISQNTGNLAGNIFVNFIALMLIEIPSYIVIALVFDKAGHKVSLVGAMMITGVSCTATAFIPSDQATIILVLSLIGKFGGAAVFGALFVYASELYPTSHRSTGLGCCSMFSRVAGIMAPVVALLGKTNPALPLLVFGLIAIIASVAMLFLPETTGCPLTQTLSESEKMGADQPWCFFPWRSPADVNAAQETAVEVGFENQETISEQPSATGPSIGQSIDAKDTERSENQESVNP